MTGYTKEANSEPWVPDATTLSIHLTPSPESRVVGRKDGNELREQGHCDNNAVRHPHDFMKAKT